VRYSSIYTCRSYLMIASSRSELAGPMPSAVTIPGGTLARSVSTARYSSVHVLPRVSRAKGDSGREDDRVRCGGGQGHLIGGGAV